MTCDSVLDFEKRRNVPIRYNRDLMVQTIQAMKRVDEIKAARMQRHFDKRMDAHKDKKRRDVENELMKHTGLIDNLKVKTYIIAKKDAKIKAKQDRIAKNNRPLGVRAKMAVMNDDVQMEDSESEEVVETVKQVAVVKKSLNQKRKIIGKNQQKTPQQ